MNEPFQDNELISRSEAARRSNRTEGQIREWILDGRLKVHADGSRWGKVRWGEVKEVIQNLDLSMSRKHGDLPPAELLNLTEAKRRNEFWKSEEKRLEVARKRGDLVQSALVTNFVAELSIAFKEGIYSAQDRIAPKIDIKTARIMRREFDKAINGIGEAGKKLAEKIRAAIEECNS